jgi:hypothetical protein
MGDKIPNAFQCSISCCRMRDPVVMRDGYSYEREGIAKWVERQGISPFNPKRKLDMKDALVSFSLKAAISQWLETYTFPVAVKSKCGRIITITLKLTNKVIDLKEKVSAQTRESVRGMRFFYGDRLLDDEQTVEDCEFQTGAIVHEPFQISVKSKCG